jgi:hypothetical protein
LHVTEEPRGITREERNASWTGSKCNVSRTKASVIHKHRDGAELCAAAVGASHARVRPN